MGHFERFFPLRFSVFFPLDTHLLSAFFQKRPVFSEELEEFMLSLTLLFI